jgi:hypothetical protein
LTWGKNGNGTVIATVQIKTVLFYSHGRILEKFKIEKIDHIKAKGLLFPRMPHYVTIFIFLFKKLAKLIK